jgi:hypothetical protein
MSSQETKMKRFDIRSACAIAAMGLLSACGGSGGSDRADGATTTTAALMVQGGNSPRADCEAEGCNRPRIIDGLAEQYRANAIAQQAQLSEPVPAAEPQSAAEPVQAAPTEAAPAAAVQAL